MIFDENELALLENSVTYYLRHLDNMKQKFKSETTSSKQKRAALEHLQKRLNTRISFDLNKDMKF